MLTSIVPETLGLLNNFIRVAEVTEIRPDKQIKVKLTDKERSVELLATFAMGHMPLPAIGDQVLLTGETADKCYVIGHMPQQDASLLSMRKDPQSGHTLLTVPEGDLELRSDKGNINLHAAQDIKLTSESMSVDTDKARLDMKQTKYTGITMAAQIAQSRVFIGKLTSTVGRLLERTKNVFRQVENLQQTQAGRVRTLVDGSYHLKGNRITQKADKEVNIDGEKINLG